MVMQGAYRTAHAQVWTKKTCPDGQGRSSKSSLPLRFLELFYQGACPLDILRGNPHFGP